VTDRVAAPTTATPSADAGGVAVSVSGTPRRKRFSTLTRVDRLILVGMVAVPTFLVFTFILLPTVLSIILSFTSWNGIGGIDKIKFVGFDNYANLFTKYKPFWPALSHNIIWLVWFLVIATPLGLLFAIILDKGLRGSRVYQSVLYMPVVLSLAIVGFIWQLQYAPDQGFLNNALHTTTSDANFIDWLGNKNINLWAVLVAASWRHVGYVMVLYLAGLKAVDPSLREAAQIDGANERQTFVKVIFPVLKPINVVVLVITVIESLRAFDIAYIINRGKNGLELLSILVTNNLVGEASLVGFGSAIAVVLLLISIGPIIYYLVKSVRAEAQ
jgi:multiple sugar transport system permease protein